MAKSIAQRISDSFQGDEAAAQAKEYSKSVYDAWAALSTSLTRSSLLIFLLIAIFELLAYQRASASISIGSFTLVNSPVVLIALPTVIGFTFYDGLRLSFRWLDLEMAYTGLVKIYAKRQVDNDLDILVRPHVPSLWSIGTSPSASTMQRADKFADIIDNILSPVLVFLVPLAFECQAYYRLIQKFGFHNVLLWISMVAAALLMTCSFIYAYLHD
jgi:hypothetical protein